MSERKEEFILAVAALITDERDRVLLVRRPKEPGAGCWHHPSGRVNFGETTRQALVRKAKEELGLEIRVTSNLPVEITQSVIPAENRHIVCLYFLAEIVDGVPKPRVGGSAAFVSAQEARELQLLDACRAVQRSVFRWDF